MASSQIGILACLPVAILVSTTSEGVAAQTSEASSDRTESTSTAAIDTTLSGSGSVGNQPDSDEPQSAEDDAEATTPNESGVASWGGTQCEETHASGQIARQSKRLLHAREEFQRCSQRHCHDEIRRDCIVWYEEVERSIPTVVFGVRAGTRELFDFTVFLDDKIVATGQDSTAVELDPGIYQFRVRTPRHKSTTMHTRIREGEKNRIIDILVPVNKPESSHGTAAVVTPPRAAADNTSLRDGITVGLGAVSLLSAGVAVLSYLSATSRIAAADDPATGCSPACGDDVMTPIHRRLLATDIALAASIVSGGGALSLWLTRAASNRSDFVAKGNSQSPLSSRALAVGFGGTW